MITIQITDEEALILRGIIEAFIEDTAMEIRHTEDHEYHEILAKQLELVKRLQHDIEMANVRKEIA